MKKLCALLAGVLLSVTSGISAQQLQPNHIDPRTESRPLPWHFTPSYPGVTGVDTNTLIGPYVKDVTVDSVSGMLTVIKQPVGSHTPQTDDYPLTSAGTADGVVTGGAVADDPQPSVNTRTLTLERSIGDDVVITGLLGLSNIAPSDVVPGQTAHVGTQHDAATRDHRHASPKGTPREIGTVAVIGDSGEFSDSGHGHPDPDVIVDVEVLSSGELRTTTRVGTVTTEGLPAGDPFEGRSETGALGDSDRFLVRINSTNTIAYISYDAFRLLLTHAIQDDGSNVATRYGFVNFGEGINADAVTGGVLIEIEDEIGRVLDANVGNFPTASADCERRLAYDIIGSSGLEICVNRAFVTMAPTGTFNVIPDRNDLEVRNNESDATCNAASEDNFVLDRGEENFYQCSVIFPGGSPRHEWTQSSSQNALAASRSDPGFIVRFLGGFDSDAEAIANVTSLRSNSDYFYERGNAIYRLDRTTYVSAGTLQDHWLWEEIVDISADDIRDGLDLTETETNNLVVSVTVSDNTLTFTENDGDVITYTPTFNVPEATETVSGTVRGITTAEIDSGGGTDFRGWSVDRVRRMLHTIIPDPDTSNNGQVLGVQGGNYALVTQQTGGEGASTADAVTTDTTEFNGILSADDVNVQLALNTIDNEASAIVERTPLTYGLSPGATVAGTVFLTVEGNVVQAHVDMDLLAARFYIDMPDDYDGTVYGIYYIPLRKVSDTDYRRNGPSVQFQFDHVHSSEERNLGDDTDPLEAFAPTPLEIAEDSYFAVIVRSFVGVNYLVGRAGYTEDSHVGLHGLTTDLITWIGRTAFGNTPAAGFTLDEFIPESTDIFHNNSISLRMELDYEAAESGILVGEDEGDVTYVGAPRIDCVGSILECSQQNDSEGERVLQVAALDSAARATALQDMANIEDDIPESARSKILLERGTGNAAPTAAGIALLTDAHEWFFTPAHGHNGAGYSAGEYGTITPLHNITRLVQDPGAGLPGLGKVQLRVNSNGRIPRQNNLCIYFRDRESSHTWRAVNLSGGSDGIYESSSQSSYYFGDNAGEAQEVIFRSISCTNQTINSVPSSNRIEAYSDGIKLGQFLIDTDLGHVDAVIRHDPRIPDPGPNDNEKVLSADDGNYVLVDQTGGEGGSAPDIDLLCTLSAGTRASGIFYEVCNIGTIADVDRLQIVSRTSAVGRMVGAMVPGITWNGLPQQSDPPPMDDQSITEAIGFPILRGNNVDSDASGGLIGNFYMIKADDGDLWVTGTNAAIVSAAISIYRHHGGGGTTTTMGIDDDSIEDFAKTANPNTQVQLVKIPDLPASRTTSGQFDISRIPGLPASQTVSGTFHADRIPPLPASKIASGQLAEARLPSSNTLDSEIEPWAFQANVSTVDLDKIPDLPASITTSGEFDADRIPNLSATKITSDVLALARIPDLDASKTVSGTFDVARFPDENALDSELINIVVNPTGEGTDTVEKIQVGSDIYNIPAFDFTTDYIIAHNPNVTDSIHRWNGNFYTVLLGSRILSYKMNVHPNGNGGYEGKIFLLGRQSSNDYRRSGDITTSVNREQAFGTQDNELEFRFGDGFHVGPGDIVWLGMRSDTNSVAHARFRNNATSDSTINAFTFDGWTKIDDGFDETTDIAHTNPNNGAYYQEINFTTDLTVSVVEANPPGTDGADLNRLRVNGESFNIVGGGLVTASITDTDLNVDNPPNESVTLGASRQAIAEAIQDNRFNIQNDVTVSATPAASDKWVFADQNVVGGPNRYASTSVLQNTIVSAAVVRQRLSLDISEVNTLVTGAGVSGNTLTLTQNNGNQVFFVKNTEDEIEDIVGGALTDSSTVTWDYNDSAGTITATATGVGGTTQVATESTAGIVKGAVQADINANETDDVYGWTVPRFRGYVHSLVEPYARSDISDNVPLSRGGTGASGASGARSNLGLNNAHVSVSRSAATLTFTQADGGTETEVLPIASQTQVGLAQFSTNSQALGSANNRAIAPANLDSIFNDRVASWAQEGNTSDIPGQKLSTGEIGTLADNDTFFVFNVSGGDTANITTEDLRDQIGGTFDLREDVSGTTSTPIARADRIVFSNEGAPGDPNAWADFETVFDGMRDVIDDNNSVPSGSDRLFGTDENAVGDPVEWFTINQLEAVIGGTNVAANPTVDDDDPEVNSLTIGNTDYSIAHPHRGPYDNSRDYGVGDTMSTGSGDNEIFWIASEDIDAGQGAPTQQNLGSWWSLASHGFFRGQVSEGNSYTMYPGDTWISGTSFLISLEDASNVTGDELGRTDRSQGIINLSEKLQVYTQQSRPTSWNAEDTQISLDGSNLATSRVLGIPTVRFGIPVLETELLDNYINVVDDVEDDDLLLISETNETPGNSNSLVAFDDFVDSVQSSAFSGARVELNSDQAISNSGLDPIEWDAQAFDVGGWWSSSNRSHLIVPSGVDYAVVTGGIAETADSPTSIFTLQIIRYNSGGGSPVVIAETKGNFIAASALQVNTGPVAVTAGQYFQLVIRQDQTGVVLDGDRSAAEPNFFSVHVP